MTIEEMHIEIDLDLQKVNSNIKRNLLSQEKDRYLNRAIKKFINLRSNPKTNIKKEGYEESQKRIDDLQDITVTVPLTLYKHDNYNVKSILPYNYHKKINIDCNVSYGCKNVSDNLEESTVYIRPCLFTLNDDATDLYKNLKIDLVNNGVVVQTLFDINNYSPYSIGLADLDLKFELQVLIRDEINKLDGYQVYWEKFNGKFYNNRFILLTENTNNYTGLHIVTDTLDYTIQFSTISLISISASNLLTQENVSARIQSSEDYSGSQSSNFGKSLVSSPLGKIENGLIFIGHDNTFIPTTCNFTYIREPQVVNLVLKQNCDLNDEYHPEIIEIACSLIRARFTGEYQVNKTEDIINE